MSRLDGVGLRVFNETDRHDRRLRWTALVAVLVATQVLGIIVSFVARFWDPWLFAMLAAPAMGVGIGVLGLHVLRSGRVWWRLNRTRWSWPQRWMRMDQREARRLLFSHVEQLRRRSYTELVRYVDDVEAFQVVGESGTIYTIEIQAVWDSGGEGGDLRVIADIDDGRLLWWFLPVVVPLTEDFIIAPDGSFVGE